MTGPAVGPGPGSDEASHTTPTIVSRLEEESRRRPDKLFLRFPDEDLTYGAFAKRARSFAAGLRRHVVREAGTDPPAVQVIPTLLPNCADGIALWFACNRVGAVWAPINTQFRGDGLAHALNLTGSPDLVVDEALVSPVLEIAEELEYLKRLFVRPSAGAAEPFDPAPRFEQTPLPILAAEEDEAPPVPPRSPADPSLLIYTSGTTGRSKACELSHFYVLGQADLLSRSLAVTERDVLFCPYPIFHWDATIGTVIPALLHGATAVIAERFSASRFWDDVRRFGVTIFDFMGATLTFVYNQDPCPDDAENPARLGWGVPMPPFRADFEQRFAVTLVEGYGSTEGGVMVCQEPGERYPEGSCGKAVPEWRLRIADDDDNTLGPGVIGEIAVKPAKGEDRHLLMTGYYRMPEVNAEALRGGWFHTGDLGRLDEAGNLFFEGRKKDSIRRRGENISAFEIEQVIEGHPAVLEVAAYGVPSEYTEDDVAVAVALKGGHRLSSDELIEFCRGRMARYMVPTHVRFLDALPKTPTEKVAKQALKAWHRRHGPQDPAA